MTQQQTEILVHIAAADGAADNARYRALAQAYASFEPSRRVDIVRTSEQQSETVAGSAVNDNSSEAHRQPCSSVPLASGRSLQFLSLSFESVWDNAQSPGIGLVSRSPPGAVGGHSRLSPRPEPKSHLPQHILRQDQYVSPDDYVLDSQAEAEPRASRQGVPLEHGLGLPTSSFEISRIEESQDLGSNVRIGEADNGPAEKRNRDVASPDLSAMPIGLPDDSSSQPREPFQLPSPRQALFQRSVNSQRSLQQGSHSSADQLRQQDIIDSSLRNGISIHSWEAVSSSCVDDATTSPTPLAQNNTRHADSGGHISSSLPEEVGKVIVKAEKHSSELLQELSTTGVTTLSAVSIEQQLLRVDSEPARTKRRRLASDTFQAKSNLVDDIEDSIMEEVCKEDAQSKPNRSVATTMATEGVSILDLPMSSASSAPSLSGLHPGYSLNDKSLRIMPPEPPVACDHLDATSLITEKMAKLARDLDIERRFSRPAAGHDSRAVRPFERGYWRLNTSGWPASLRHQAWAFLSKYVGRGDAGWSVWCSRDPEPHTWLRLHCFAAMAGHTYLLIYLASQRQILTTGAVWLDGSGTPTITIPPRPRKQDQQQVPGGRIGSGSGSATGISTAVYAPL